LPKSAPVIRRTGSGGKSTPQACSTCSKNFSNASALAKHRLTHSEERRYHCNLCSKAFKRQDHLNGHLLTHRTTKPFACVADGCGKSYCDARSLRRHKENHHNGAAVKEQETEIAGNGNVLASTPSLSVSAVAELSGLSSGVTATLVQNPTYCSSVSDNPPVRDMATKVTAKGLSPQQFQLIEQLFKDSKNLSSAITSGSTSITTSSSTTNASNISSSQSQLPIVASSSAITAVPYNINDPPPVPSSPKKTDAASITALNVAAKALAAVQNQAFHLNKLSALPANSASAGTAQGDSNGVTTIMLAEKPVECTICNRKFKNIPALNGHMRLHGGYYKKDADGKKVVNLPPVPDNNGGTGGHLRPLLEEPMGGGSKKRKLEENEESVAACIGNDKLSAEAIRILHRHTPSATPGIAMKQPPTSPSDTSQAAMKRIATAMGKQQGSSVPISGSGCCNRTSSSSPAAGASSDASTIPFICLPAPDTSQLLANLERKAKEQQQAAVAAAVVQQHQHQNSSSSCCTFPTRPIPLTPSSSYSAPSPPTSSSPPALVIKPANIVSIASTTTACHHQHQCHRPPTNCVSSKYNYSSSGHACHLMRVDVERDKTPRISQEYQADIPDLYPDPKSAFLLPDKAELVWDPSVAVSLETRSPCGPLQSYLRIASSCLLPGGSRNEELALQALARHSGNVHLALRSLMAASTAFSTLRDTSAWSEAEVNGFYECLVRHHKSFDLISADLGTKSVKECVEYYYLWKNVCKEESRSFKTIFNSAPSQPFMAMETSMMSNGHQQQPCMMQQL
jgi:hypothetical protein